MAKKRASKSTADASTLEVPKMDPITLNVKFGRVSASDKNASVGITTSRAGLTEKEVDKLLCVREITATLRRGGDQRQLEGEGFADDDAGFEVSAKFITGAVSHKPKAYSTSMVTQLGQLSFADLQKFAGQQGLLTITEISTVPKKAKATAKPNGKPHANGAPTLPGLDAGSGMPIDALCQYGLTPKKAEALDAAVKGGTVGDLERLISTNEWWHRDIKGFGETYITKLIDALVAFRKDYPVPSDEPAEQPPEPAAQA